MDGWSVLIFGIIPVLTTAVIYFVQKKILWTAPWISAALALIAYMLALAPITIGEVFSNNEWRGFFFLAMLMQFIITVVLTAAAYFAAYIKQKYMQ